MTAPLPLPVNHLAHELEQLRADYARQERNLQLLRDIAMISRGGVDLQEVFGFIHDRLQTVLPVDAFFVALCDSPNSRTYHVAYFVDEGKRIELADQNVGGLTGWILDLGEARLFRDLHRERGRDVPDPHQFGNRSRRSRSWIGVPMMVGRVSVGVMSIQSYQEAVFDEHDLKLLQAIADLTAVTIENALLYQMQDELSASLAARVAARSEELAVLTTIACGLSQGQYDDVRLSEALERILWMLNLSVGIIWLDEAERGLRRAATSIAVRPEDSNSLPSSDDEPDPIAVEVCQRNQPLILSSTRDQNGAACSLFAQPLLAHGRCVGVIVLYGDPGRELADHEHSLLEAASQQIGIGVENARLYDEARWSARIAEHRADNLALVHRISHLISSSLDPVEVLQITAEQMVRLFGVDHCGAMLFDASGVHGQVITEFPDLGIVGLQVTFAPDDYLEMEPGHGRPGFVTDIATDPRVRVLREAATRLRVRAMLLVPLISRGRSIGAVSLNLIQTMRDFSEEDLELCRTIAIQVATALENARLYQMSVTRVEQEMEIARSIQANLFPNALPAIPGALLAGRCLPAQETGGDFYDVLPVGYNRFGFSIGDVSGKSLSAAMLMAVARSIVRSEAIDHATPERVVTETNRLVAQDVPPNTFVALCYAVYEAGTRTLVIANAGQIIPLLRHADGTVDILSIVSHFPLGIVPTLQYEANGVKLESGDSVLFLTDGLVEAFSPDGVMFGFDRLADLFSRLGALPAEEVVDELLQAVCEWQGDENRHDDMTAVVIQVL
jgi:phosphoserine phosphatase RsbU/P